MRHSEIIYLISETVTQDELGNDVSERTERMVYANEFEVGTTEFYEAKISNMKPEKRFEIYSFEYNDESLMKHEDKLYSIIRVQKKGEKTRITCERDIGNG